MLTHKEYSWNLILFTEQQNVHALSLENYSKKKKKKSTEHAIGACFEKEALHAWINL